MKCREIVKVAIIAFIIFSLILAIAPNKVSATENKMYLGIVEKRSSEQYGYAITDPEFGGQKLWKILEYQGMSSDSGLKTGGKTNIYCLKSGVGFSDTSKKAEYNLSLDMKTQKDLIESQGEVLASIVNGTVPYKEASGTSDVQVSKYGAILALCDMLCLSEDAKIEYLAEAGISSKVNVLEYGEIEAVQQAALWYFTNYGDTSKDFDKTNKDNWLYYTTDGATYVNIGDLQSSDNLKLGIKKQEQANTLYRYLIQTAKANAGKYTKTSSEEDTTEKDSTNKGAPATLLTSTLSYKEEGSRYIIGPINIKEAEDNLIPYTIDLTVKINGVETNDYKILNDEDEEISSSSLKNLAKENEDFYISVEKEGTTSISVFPKINYTRSTFMLWTSEKGLNTTQPVMIPESKSDCVGKELSISPNVAPYDLALRQYITKVKNGSNVETINTRIPDINKGTIGTEKTATYKHRKDPVPVKNGSIITYNITIYNEGEKAGRALEIVDQLPKGLKFLNVVGENQTFEKYSYDEDGENRLVLRRKASNETNLPEYKNGNLASETIQIECEVIEDSDNSERKVLTNVVWISKAYDAVSKIEITNQVGADIDSEPSTSPNVNKNNMENYIGYTGDDEHAGNKLDLTDSGYFYKGEQDDDDFEKVVLLPLNFDLKLIKNITKVDEKEISERLLSVEDIDILNKIDSDNNVVETATYNMNKKAVSVKRGSIVTYRIRVYNEGTIDGYASEITENIPEGLEFIWSENEGEALKNDKTLTEEEKEAVAFNQKYLWGNFKYDEKKEKIIRISTRYLDIFEGQVISEDASEEEIEAAKSTKYLIKAFDSTKGYVDSKTLKNPDYREVYVKLKVSESAEVKREIRSIAWVSDDSDEVGSEISDRDSTTEEWTEDKEDTDDDGWDYEKVEISSFDLALRKFITKVDDKNITTRIPKVKYENKKISYVQDKSEFNVVDGNVVTYTIRVFNEGDVAGYAKEITDNIPEGLVFLPDDSTNKEMKWKMIDAEGKETTDSSKAVKITTRYLDIYEGKEISETASKEEKEKAKSTKNLLRPFDPDADIEESKKDSLNPDYRDVKAVFKVTKPNSTNKVFVNLAQISQDEDEYGNEIDDDDSIPNVIRENDDDQDKETIKLVEFDLALKKWVTQTIVIDSKGTTVTNTGNNPNDKPKPVVKVELNKNKLDEVTVKFKYSIRVINEGDIPGYAKEIVDYVPEGLKFIESDNQGVWVDEGNNVILTKALQNKLLKPGESADVEVILTAIIDKNGMGVKVNTAEISDADNEYHAPDRDSTPKNKNLNEDDIDQASILLSIATGKAKTYFTLGAAVLVTLGVGVILIKKYVL